MSNYIKRLFTFAQVRLEQRESAETPGQWDLISVNFYMNPWKLALLLLSCGILSSTLTLLSVFCALSLVSQ